MASLDIGTALEGSELNLSHICCTSCGLVFGFEGVGDAKIEYGFVALEDELEEVRMEEVL